MFKKRYKNGEDPQVRYRIGRLAGAVTVGTNFLLFLLKFSAAFFLLKGSVSLLADSFNSLGDATSGIISLFAFKLASKPADEKHPYGHGRYEYVATLTVSILILILGVELLESGIQKIIHPKSLNFSLPVIFILMFSILSKIFLMVMNIRLGKFIHSETLIATGKDSRNDIICTGALLISLLLSDYTTLPVDGMMAVAISIFILVSAILMIKDTLNPIIGCMPDKKEIETLKEKILSYEGVLGTHDLLIHDYGVGTKFASVHIELSSERDALSSHALIDKIERDVEKEFRIHLVAHYDPVENSTVCGVLREHFLEKAHSLSPEISVHDLYLEPHATCTELHLDCVLPENTKVTKEEIEKVFSSVLEEQHLHYVLSLHIDRSYFSSNA